MSRLAAACALTLAIGAPAAAAPCLTGAYRHPSGEVLVLTADPDPAARRFVLTDGRTGLLRPAGRGRFQAGPGWGEAEPVTARAVMRRCHPRAIRFDLEGGPKGAWARLPLHETPVRFHSGRITLSGRWVTPPGASATPAVVLVHGSADTPYVNREPWHWMLPALGVSILIYDKRGTGDSGGVYTQDFSVLADDAAAAVAEARRRGGERITRLGLLGLSQGGWIAPLAAARAPVDFVQVGYGVVGTPLEQDQWQVRYELVQAGFGAPALAEADRLTQAAAEVAATDFQAQFGAFGAVLAGYRDRPWLHRFEGQYTGLLVRGAVEQARAESPQVPWRHDALAALRNVRVPQFWILAGDDGLAPSAPTLARLQALRAEGAPIEAAVFPQADHGIREFRVTSEGRTRTRWAEGYFQLQADWILGRLRPPYGRAEFILPGATR